MFPRGYVWPVYSAAFGVSCFMKFRSTTSSWSPTCSRWRHRCVVVGHYVPEML